MVVRACTLNMCRKLKLLLYLEKKIAAAVYVTCFGLRLVANVLGPGK